MLAREGCLTYVLTVRNAQSHEWNTGVVDDLLGLASPPCAVRVFTFDWKSGNVCAKMRCSLKNGADGNEQSGWVWVVVDPLPLRNAKTHEHSYVFAVEEPCASTADETEWERRHPLCPYAQAFFNDSAWFERCENAVQHLTVENFRK